jgi:hypothetical protein
MMSIKTKSKTYNYSLTSIISFTRSWLRIRFYDIDIDKHWFSIRLINASWNFSRKQLEEDNKEMNLFYYHKSPYLIQLDLFFVKFYEKFFE